MTETEQSATRQTVRVRDAQGNVETFPNATFVAHSDSDLGVYQSGTSTMLASFARGQWVSARITDDQPEQVDGPLSIVVAETIAGEIEAEYALAKKDAHSGTSTEPCDYLNALLRAAHIARAVGARLAGPNGGDREGLAT